MQRNIGMLKREASAEMAGNVMEAVYQQNGPIIDALSSTKYDDQRIARDLPVKVAHKIGDAYDFRHDVAIVYTNSPYVIAILQIIRIMIRFPIFQKISMRY